MKKCIVCLAKKTVFLEAVFFMLGFIVSEIGRASCRERVLRLV